MTESRIPFDLEKYKTGGIAVNSKGQQHQFIRTMNGYSQKILSKNLKTGEEVTHLLDGTKGIGGDTAHTLSMKNKE